MDTVTSTAVKLSLLGATSTSSCCPFLMPQHSNSRERQLHTLSPVGILILSSAHISTDKGRITQDAGRWRTASRLLIADMIQIWKMCTYPFFLFPFGYIEWNSLSPLIVRKTLHLNVGASELYIYIESQGRYLPLLISVDSLAKSCPLIFVFILLYRSWCIPFPPGGLGEFKIQLYRCLNLTFPFHLLSSDIVFTSVDIYRVVLAGWFSPSGLWWSRNYSFWDNDQPCDRINTCKYKEVCMKHVETKTTLSLHHKENNSSQAT